MVGLNGLPPTVTLRELTVPNPVSVFLNVPSAVAEEPADDLVVSRLFWEEAVVFTRSEPEDDRNDFLDPYELPDL